MDPVTWNKFLSTLSDQQLQNMKTSIDEETKRRKENRKQHTAEEAELANTQARLTLMAKYLVQINNGQVCILNDTNEKENVEECAKVVDVFNITGFEIKKALFDDGTPTGESYVIFPDPESADLFASTTSNAMKLLPIT